MHGKKAVVEAADPKAMLGIVGNEQLDAIADEAKERFTMMYNKMLMGVIGTSLLIVLVTVCGIREASNCIDE